MQPLQTPSSDHLEFDQFCLGVEEFEPLPDHVAVTLGRELPAEASNEDTPADGLILAGLVSPV